MSDKPELLACPCCGSVDTKRYEPYGIKSVRCNDCHASLRECDWQRRAAPQGYKLVPVEATTEMVSVMEAMGHGTIADVWAAGVDAST